MIGYSPSKFTSVNSSTGFQRANAATNSNFDKGKTSHNVTNVGAKKVGGTLSHSQKSLRSTSSQRKRVSSVDAPTASNQYRIQS